MEITTSNYFIPVMNIDEYYSRGFWPWNKIFGIGELYGMGSTCKYMCTRVYTHISVPRMIRLPMFGHVCSVQHILMMCKRCSCRIYRKQKFVRIDRGKSVFERIFFSLNYTLSLLTKSLYNRCIIIERRISITLTKLVFQKQSINNSYLIINRMNGTNLLIIFKHI